MATEFIDKARISVSAGKGCNGGGINGGVVDIGFLP